jgi:hypothetical protein
VITVLNNPAKSELPFILVYKLTGLNGSRGKLLGKELPVTVVINEFGELFG